MIHFFRGENCWCISWKVAVGTVLGHICDWFTQKYLGFGTPLENYYIMFFTRLDRPSIITLLFKASLIVPMLFSCNINKIIWGCFLPLYYLPPSAYWNISAKVNTPGRAVSGLTTPGSCQQKQSALKERTYRNPKFGGLPTTIEDEVEIYARLRAAGMIRWSSERRAVEHLVPFAEFAPITTEWAAELPRR